MFAALSTVEPPIVERSMAALFERDKPWHAERLVMLDDRVGVRLGELSRHLAEAEWLDGAFSDGHRVAASGQLGAGGGVPERRALHREG